MGHYRHLLFWSAAEQKTNKVNKQKQVNYNNNNNKHQILHYELLFKLLFYLFTTRFIWVSDFDTFS